jgi:hypothetical protein
LPPVSAQTFAEFNARYAGDAALFVREVFDAIPDPWQERVLKKYDARNRRISIRSGHGVGKTTLLAWIIVHHLLFRIPQRTVCTAPTQDQLFGALANEVKKWVASLPPALQELVEVKVEQVELKAAPYDSFVQYRVSRADKPEALAGVHAENVLLIGDEASGIPDPIFEAASGSMSGENATTILAGNPVRSSGLFYDTHHTQRGRWETEHVSCEDCSRVTPDFLEDMRLRYGERSNAYRVRVLGEFPLADDDTVIPFELMEAALKRDVGPLGVNSLWGLDVARFGPDASALAKRRGNVLEEPVRKWHGLDNMELVGRIVDEYRSCVAEQRPEEILVDAIGMGSGVADRLREMGLPARAINVSESPALGTQYRNLRAELWFKARDWLAKRDSNLCGDQDLGAQLVSVKYKFTSNGKRQIESKDDIKKRGFQWGSPDLADAFVLTFASDAATAMLGNTQRDWKQPLRRNIKGIV